MWVPTFVGLWVPTLFLDYPRLCFQFGRAPLNERLNLTDHLIAACRTGRFEAHVKVGRKIEA